MFDSSVQRYINETVTPQLIGLLTAFRLLETFIFSTLVIIATNERRDQALVSKKLPNAMFH